MQRTAMAVVLAGALGGFGTGPASAMTIWLGDSVAESATPECEGVLGVNINTSDYVKWGSVFHPGDLAGNDLDSRLTFRNAYVDFVARVPGDVGTSTPGVFAVQAIYTGHTMNGLGDIAKRSGRVTSVTMSPAPGPAVTFINMTIRLTNALSTPGCTITFRGVYKRIDIPSGP